jgi:hypothetical protein
MLAAPPVGAMAIAPIIAATPGETQKPPDL